MRNWSETVSRLVGEQDVSLWRLDAEDLQPGPWPEPTAVWASRERGREEPSAIPPMRQKGPQDGCGSKEEIHGVMVASLPSGHKPGSDQPRLGRLEEGV